MGIDRPSRSSEDDDQPRRGEQKPTEREESRPSRPERPQSRAERGRPETREEADARIEARERAEHQNMTLAEALARTDKEEGPDDDFPALSRGNVLSASPDRHGGEQADRPKTETTDGAQARIEAARGELRTALDSGDDAQLVEAARRLVDAADNGERTGERSPDMPADAVPVEGADNKPLDPWAERPVREWRDGDPPIEPGELSVRDDVVYARPERRDDKNPDSGLGRPDAAPNPSLTPEQHQEKITEQRGQAGEVLGADTWSNSKYAGEIFLEKLSPKLKERFPEGVQFSDEGFPQFDRYAAKTVTFHEGFRGPDRTDDFARANQVFGWRNTPENMVWHHKEDGMTMVLVDRKLHNTVRHYGGVTVSKQMGVWEGEGRGR